MSQLPQKNGKNGKRDFQHVYYEIFNTYKIVDTRNNKATIRAATYRLLK